jgi:AcrR family transcriptional regulator
MRFHRRYDAPIVGQTSGPRAGLRELKKERTRELITRVALDLFIRDGFRATTLAHIADAAEISSSTLHAYFPSKEDILFSRHDAMRESIRTRILKRPESETATEALAAWISEDVPQLAWESEQTSPRGRRLVINTEPELVASARLRMALVEDDLAAAFARDLAEPRAGLRSRLMAAVVMSGINTVWTWWQPQQLTGQLDTRQLSELDGTYVMSLVRAAERVLKELPTAPASTDAVWQ